MYFIAVWRMTNTGIGYNIKGFEIKIVEETGIVLPKI